MATRLRPRSARTSPTSGGIDSATTPKAKYTA